MPEKKTFETQNVIMASAAQITANFTVQKWAVFCGVFIPAIADGSVTLEISTDGTNFFPLLDPADGQDLLICASGSDAGWIDISDFIRFVTPDMYCRIVSSVAADEEETFIIQLSG